MPPDGIFLPMSIIYPMGVNHRRYMSHTKPVYLDYNATTPLTKEVVEAMRPFLAEYFGNPSSQHFYGRITAQAIESSRRQVAGLIRAHSSEIIFTSGGTESNNLALCGAARAYAGQRRHIVTSAVEHPAVTEVCIYLGEEGFEITTLKVDEFGLVSPQDLQAALRPDTLLVSVMHANNEVGTIQPIQALAALAHEAGALFHTDAAQSVGKIPVDINELGVDLLSIAGHKLYAPKGVGALFIRQGTRLEPVTFGASQENGLRPGTENVLEIVGLGRAAQIAQQDLEANMVHFQKMRDLLQEGLLTAIGEENVSINGHPEKRLPNTLSICFKGFRANELQDMISVDVAASAGAACHADQVEISGTLAAMGIPIDWAQGTLRFSVGRMTTDQEINRAIHAIIHAVNA
jgi:cysteine desulfurase